MDFRINLEYRIFRFSNDFDQGQWEKEWDGLEKALFSREELEGMLHDYSK
jgi:hypothetical protein